MKIIKTDNPYLTKDQWRKVLLAVSIMTIALYAVAMVFSLCGSSYFILNYQNTQMDKIEAWLREYYVMGAVQDVFITLEVSILLWFVLQKKPRWYYILTIYAVPLIVYYIMRGMPSMLEVGFSMFFCVIFSLIEQLISNKRISGKEFGFQMIRLAIAIAVTFLLQLMIYVIKAGYFSTDNHVMNLSATFIYAIEYDIALSVILATISLYAYREKGDGKLWATQ